MEASISPIVIGLFVFLLLWLGVLTFLFYKSKSHYNKLTKGTNRQSLHSILDILLKDVQTNKHETKDLIKRITKQEEASEFTLQKTSLLRFNPFADTGGQQSFIIGLLDSRNSGILITSLQGRSGTRWYAKQVKEGKGVKYDLSKEEKEAVKEAKLLS